MTTFQVDVSRTYRNKEGYRVGGYKLNTSFQTEVHTPESFIDQVVNPGWPYTMVHLKRSPQETGAAARGVTTPKHTENFVSRQELTGDDDSKAPGVVEFWLNDPWFKANGFAFVESVNSIPGEAEKGHPTIIFDRPITDPVIYKAAAKALAWKYPRLDPGIHNIDRTIYNAQGARVHMLGNICKWDDFNRDVLQPYFFHLEQEQAREEARRQQLRTERQELPASDDRLEEYARRSIQGILDRVATARDGERHNIIRWAGVALGGLKAAEWVKPGLLDYIEEDVLKAAQQAGGYDDAEILRTFEWGFTTGQRKPAEKPVFYEPAPQPKTIDNNIHNCFDQSGFTLKPYRLSAEALARKERILAESKAQKEERAAEQQAVKAIVNEPGFQAARAEQKAKDDLALELADYWADENGNQVDPEEIRQARNSFTSARKWKEHCEFKWPGIDSEAQFKLKLKENRENRPCGEIRKRRLPNGQVETVKWSCGRCQACLKKGVYYYRRALCEIQGIEMPAPSEDEVLRARLEGPEQPKEGVLFPAHPGEPAPPLPRIHGPLSLITVYSDKERASMGRNLRLKGIRYRCIPITLDDGLIAYDFLINSDDGDPIGVRLTDSRLEKWVMGAEGKRSKGSKTKKSELTGRLITTSGEMLPSLGNLEKRYRDPAPYEVVMPELDDDGAPVDPDIFALTVPDIGTKAPLPDVAVDYEVTDAESLQAAILEIYNQQMAILARRPNVVYGVYSKKIFYTRYTTLPDMLEEFNARNERIKAKQATG